MTRTETESEYYGHPRVEQVYDRLRDIERVQLCADGRTRRRIVLSGSVT